MSKKQKLSKALLALMMTASMVNYAQIPTFAAENTGNQILAREVTENDGATLTVDGKTYNLLDFEFDKELTISPNTKDLSIHISGTLGGENVVRGELSGFRKTSPGGSAFSTYRIDKKSGDSSIDINVKVEDIRENVRYTVTPYGPYNYIMLQSYIHSFHFKFAEPDQAPVIEVPSAKDDRITVEQGSYFNTINFKNEIVVTDDNTPTSDIKLQVSANVKTSTLGEYPITITATDDAGNVTTKEIIAEVVPARVPIKATAVANGKTVDVLNDVDTTDKLLVVSPDDEKLVFRVDGSVLIYSTLNITEGNRTIRNIRVDNEGKDTVEIVLPKELIKENYSYQLSTFARSGIANNNKFFKIKFAEPDQAPIIEINDITIEQESDYSSRAGLKVSDDHTSEADLLKTLEITGADKVNTNVPGEYKVTYKVTDNAGNVAEKTIKVTVTPIAQPTKVTVVINGQTLDVINGIQYNEVIKIDPNTEELVFHVEGSKIIRSEVFSKDHFDILKDARDGEKLDITLAKDQIIDGAKYIVTVYDFPSHAYRQNTFVIEFDNEKPIDPEKPVTPVDPEKPVIPTNPNDGHESNVLKDEINNKSNSKQVQTSDNQEISGFMISGIVAITGLSILIKRKKYN